MSTKRLFISLFSLFSLFGLSAIQIAQAKMIDKASPLIVKASSCQGVVSDAAQYHLTLPVTEALVTELDSVIQAGETPVIAVRSSAEFTLSGNGSAEFDVQWPVPYVDRADGSRFYLDEFTEHELTSSSAELTQVMITSFSNQVMPGDNIVIEAVGQGFADAGGCGVDDHAGVRWLIESHLGSNEFLPSW